MFENLKERLKQKIEENAVKSELTWYDKKGNPSTEIVLLKKSRVPILGDWSRIYPPIDEEGNIKWVNLIFGGWKNLIKLIIVLAIVGMVLWQFKENYTLLGKAVECCNLCKVPII